MIMLQKNAYANNGIPEVVKFGRAKDKEHIEIKQICLTAELKKRLEELTEGFAEQHIFSCVMNKQLTKEDAQDTRAAIKKLIDRLRREYIDAPGVLQSFLGEQFYGERDWQDKDKLEDALTRISFELSKDQSPVDGLDEPRPRREKFLLLVVAIRRELSSGLPGELFWKREDPLGQIELDEVLSAYADGFLANLLRELLSLHDRFLDKYIEEVDKRSWAKTDKQAFRKNVSMGKYRKGDSSISDRTLVDLITDARKHEEKYLLKLI